MKSGFIAVVGKPNVGKSTFINCVIGRKVSIVSTKPQTTRFCVLGVKTGADFQIVFVDTPGFYPPRHLLGEKLIKYAKTEASSADIVLFMVDICRGMDEHDRKVADFINSSVKNNPVYLVVNKIDLVENRKKINEFSSDFEKLCNFKKFFLISSVTGEGINLLEKEIIDALPEGSKFFPDDAFTDKDERTQVSETIREKAILLTHQEVPHSIAVDVESIEPGKSKDIMYIYAIIYLEKPSQKGIVIGSGGAMLKKIGTMARSEIEKILGKKVFLDLRVKVKKDWRKKEDFLNYLGYE